MKNTSQPETTKQPAQQGPSTSESSGLYGAAIGGAAGLASGIIVAGLNYFFTRERIVAETENQKAQTEKNRLESEKLRRELEQKVDSIQSAVVHALTAENEEIIYTSAGRDAGHDFLARPDFVYKNVNGVDVKDGERGEGLATFDDSGAVNVQRTNTDGRFVLILKTYVFLGRKYALLPKDHLLGEPRKLRISFDAKIIGSEHTIRAVIKDESSNKWLASREQRISNTYWETFSMYMQVPSAQEAFLRFDNIDVRSAPSSVQIKNIVFAEKRGSKGTLT